MGLLGSSFGDEYDAPAGMLNRVRKNFPACLVPTSVSSFQALHNCFALKMVFSNFSFFLWTEKKIFNFDFQWLLNEFEFFYCAVSVQQNVISVRGSSQAWRKAYQIKARAGLVTKDIVNIYAPRAARMIICT